MKTIKQLQKESDKLKIIMSERKTKSDANTIKEYKKASKKLEYLNTLILYLETNPKKEFIENEIKRISHRINLVIDSYVEPSEEYKKIATKSLLTKMKREFEKIHDVPKLRKYLSTLEYIIK